MAKAKRSEAEKAGGSWRSSTAEPDGVSVEQIPGKTSIAAGDGETVTILRREYEALLAAVEAAEDAIDIRVLEERAGAVAIPGSVWEEIEALPSPIGPLRKWRGLTQEALAEKTGLSQGYLSQIEAGKRQGDITSLRSIASALGLGIEDVMPLED